MNILVLSWRDSKHPLAGGAEQVMMEHMKGWAKEGHEVTHFSSYFKGAENEEIVDGIKYIRKSYQLAGVQIAAFFWYLFQKHPKFDLVVDEFHGIPFFTPLYVRKPILAVIQEVAGKVWLKNDLPIPFNWIIGGIGYFVEPFIFLLYKGITFMTGSESAKESLIKVGIPRSKINIVQHGVKVVKPEPFPRKERVKTVMFLGAITQDKGIKDVLKTFCILNKRGKYNFWIAGRAGDKYRNYLKNEAKNLALDKRLKFFGYVDERKKFELLARSHILINPSVLEGWGLVNIEANCVGTPVVAYHSSGLIDSVKDGVSGVIVKQNSPNNLASAVENVLLDNLKYRMLQKGAISWSNNFNWNISKKLSIGLLYNLTK